MLRFGGRRGCRWVCTDGVVSPKSADHPNWANSSARGWRRSQGLAWTGSIPLGDTRRVRALLPSMTTSIIRRALELYLFSTDPSLVHVQVYHCFHSILRYCLTLLLKLDLQFELQSLPIPLIFCCLLLVGVGLILWCFTRTSRTSLKFCCLLSTKLSCPPYLFVASFCGTRVS